MRPSKALCNRLEMWIPTMQKWKSKSSLRYRAWHWASVLTVKGEGCLCASLPLQCRACWRPGLQPDSPLQRTKTHCSFSIIHSPLFIPHHSFPTLHSPPFIPQAQPLSGGSLMRIAGCLEWLYVSAPCPCSKCYLCTGWYNDSSSSALYTAQLGPSLALKGWMGWG